MSQNSNGETLPKESIETRIKNDLIKILKLSKEGLEHAKCFIEKDGSKAVFVIKMDTHKIGTDLHDLLHNHSRFYKESINDANHTRNYHFTIPEQYITEMSKLESTLNAPVQTDTRINKASIDDQLDNIDAKIAAL